MRTIINPLRSIESRVRDCDESDIDGQGQYEHLGGYIRGPVGDRATYYPNLWTWAIKLLNINSVIDIGCGEGHSSRFFLDLGCDVLGVEGYPPAVENTKIPGRVILHDYISGPFVPDRTFDMAWSCEFVEHVEERYLPNVFATFDRAACAFMTFATPGQGGHHHVNEQEKEYWIQRFEEYGFELDSQLTACARAIAVADRQFLSPDYPSHFVGKGLVFLKSGSSSAS